jgi:micrococcal nuclease
MSVVDEDYECLYRNIDIPLTTFDEIESKCLVTRVLDGDTVEIVMRRGESFEKHRLRISGIDAPEIRTKNLEKKRAGMESKRRLEEVLKISAGRVVVNFHGEDKYGRKLGDMKIETVGIDVREYMLENGLASLYDIQKL